MSSDPSLSDQDPTNPLSTSSGYQWGTTKKITNPRTGCIYWLIGSCHASRFSSSQISHLLKTTKPDLIAVELDPERDFALRKKLIHPNPPFPHITDQEHGMIQPVLERLEETCHGLNPDGDIITVYREAGRNNVPLALVDMPMSVIQNKLNIASYNVTPWVVLSGMWWLVQHRKEIDNISQQAYQALNNLHLITNPHLVTESVPITFPRTDPTVYEQELQWRADALLATVYPLASLFRDFPIFQVFDGPLIDQRNKYIASNLRSVAGVNKTIVGIFGEFHIPGIVDELPNHQADEGAYRQKLLEPTKPNRLKFWGTWLPVIVGTPWILTWSTIKLFRSLRGPPPGTIMYSCLFLSAATIIPSMQALKDTNNAATTNNQQKASRGSFFNWATAMFTRKQQNK